ncbi:MAG: alpha-ketoacid dehydrogenase subunit beta [Candidatus Omnitrophica bacterium]|nr:alpha-ketoacid dehydrogenase subunit beta [Candidatus Omnitrophota bacterium]MBD3269680.1 alpha-ketoacid dehydrogenase subunit beta [Candidatus Omnitrophota bacterium]
MRRINYRDSLREAMYQAMKRDPHVFVMGCGSTSPKGIFGTLKGLDKKFGKLRVIETPIAENGMTGIAIGSSLMGMRPVLVHQRIDFILLSLDQIINHAAKWFYMFGGSSPVPITIRSIIGKGWGQGAQHSQNLQAIFAHIPGLKVVMPSNPYDAKGLFISSIEDENPVIFIEHRRLYNKTAHVPPKYYRVSLGKGKISRKGTEVSIVAVSLMVDEALKAARILKKNYKIDAEVIDLRSLRPLDREIIFDSLKKTGRLLVADTGFKPFGVGAEICALGAEHCLNFLKAPPKRVGLPESPTPTSIALEKVYYPNCYDIVQGVIDLFSAESKKSFARVKIKRKKPKDVFKGPF